MVFGRSNKTAPTESGEEVQPIPGLVQKGRGTPRELEDVSSVDDDKSRMDKMKEKLVGFKKDVKRLVGDGYEKLPQSMQDRIESIVAEAKAEVEELKLKIQEKIAHEVSVQLDRALDKAGEVAKGSLKDPEMPRIVQKTIDSTVDGLMPDVKEEVLESVAVKLRKVEEVNRGQPFGWCPNPIRRFRAWVLYTLEPDDMTIWQVIRNPWWWLLQIPPSFPRYGVSQIWFILLLLFKDKRDEYQLVKFIVQFKSFQFFTIGVIPSIFGGFQLYFCAIRDDPTCREDAPRLEYFELAFFSVQVWLTWIAYFLLPFSVKKGKLRFVKMTEKELSLEEKTQSCCGPVYKKRGGKLGRFVLLDTLVFFLIVGLMGYVEFRDRTNLLNETSRRNYEWQVFAGFFFAKILYGVLSLPWLVFQIPFFFPLLTHAKTTMYSTWGETVPRSKKMKRGMVTQAADKVAGNY